MKFICQSPPTDIYIVKKKSLHLLSLSQQRAHFVGLAGCLKKGQLKRGTFRILSSGISHRMALVGIFLCKLDGSGLVSGLAFRIYSSQRVTANQFVHRLILEHRVLSELMLKEFENRVCDDHHGFGLVYFFVLCTILQSV